MSAGNYAYSIRGTLNGEFLSVSGNTDWKDGVANTKATVGEGAPWKVNSWVWSWISHYGFAYMPDGGVENPCDKYAHHITSHWWGEDGSHIWAKNKVDGAEGAWAGDIHCVAEKFVVGGALWGGKVKGQWPSHWVATARSDKEVDVHGVVTYKMENGGTYTAHVHHWVQFYEPIVKLTRHYWKLDVVDGGYYADNWWHKEVAIADTTWNFGTPKDKMTFDWSFFGSINDMAIEGSGHGFGSGYRQHQWGRGGGKAFGEYGRPNLVWALGWEGHAGLHFFARFPKGLANPVIESLPEGFVVHRKWYGQDGAYWKTTHDVRFAEGHINKRIVLVGAHFPEKGIMFAPASGPDYDKGRIIKRSYPQYVTAIPKGDKHIWYRGTFQFELENGSFYSGYWEQDVHCRKKIEKMPHSFVLRFDDETWKSDGWGWNFYEREEVEPSTYDAIAPSLKSAPAAAPAPMATPMAKPVAKPVAEPVAEPVAAQVAEPVAAQVAEPVAAQVAEPAPEPVAAPEPLPVPEPASVMA